MKVLQYVLFFIVSAAIGFIGRGYMPKAEMPDTAAMMGGGEQPPAAVGAIEITERPIDIQQEYIASVEPVQEVMVRTEVPGYIDKVHFTEGAFVNEGDLLFTIDQKQYMAQVKICQAELASAEAELDRSDKYLKRMQEVSQRSVSQTEIDTAESKYLQAQAAIKQAQANLDLAQINLDYTEIKAPISGRIGAAGVTKGNYVTSASEPLARIVQTDPIRIVFSITDREYYDLKKTQGGDLDNLEGHIRLPNGDMLDKVGEKDFDDNAISSETGTMAVRYLFDNPDGTLISGGYVNVLLGRKEVPMGILVPQKALLADADGKFVLTAGADGAVGMVRVMVGETIGSDAVILSGLKAGDTVIVDGLQKATPGAKVNVTLQEISE